VKYRDDSRGGVEANCVLELTLASGVSGIIELSRTRNLRNTCIIRGERGEIEVGVGVRGPVTVRVGATEMTADPQLAGQPVPAPLDFTRIQIEEFAEAVRNRRDCHLFAENTMESVRLFDACATSEPIEMPWEAFAGAEALPTLAGRKVLVIGATGFIGGRLTHTLASHTAAHVRVMYRDASKLSAVSRFDLETVPGDITNPESLRAAMADCDTVFNCSFGRGSAEASQLVNVEAVKTLVHEAARVGVRRVIHLSTMSAYGVPESGELREDSPLHAPRSFTYGFTKWQGERAGLAAAAETGVELFILQPTVVYGPGAPSWTQNPLRMLRSGRVVLVNGGSGRCNAVYVDDVVQAMLRAAESAQGAGERYLVSGPAAVTWREFYGAYEELFGEPSTVSMSFEELASLRRREARNATTRAQLVGLLKDPDVFRRLARLPIVLKMKEVLPRSAIVAAKRTVRGESARPEPSRRPEPPSKGIHVWAELDAQFQASTATVSIEKAQRVIGYRPAHDFRSGMALTGAWARWANLLG
jgi:nucleoside-diphosphate-sugar epimerase